MISFSLFASMLNIFLLYVNIFVDKTLPGGTVYTDRRKNPPHAVAISPVHVMLHSESGLLPYLSCSLLRPQKHSLANWRPAIAKPFETHSCKHFGIVISTLSSFRCGMARSLLSSKQPRNTCGTKAKRLK